MKNGNFPLVELGEGENAELEKKGKHRKKRAAGPERDLWGFKNAGSSRRS